MAFTATFTADTARFDEALRNAAQTVRVFGQNSQAVATGVQASFQRMVTSFDGSKITAEAAKTVAAVERIGGASKLTEAEQKRVNATVTEAIAKYTALGQSAPAAMLKLARETESTGKSMTGLSGMVQTAVGSFAGFVTAQAVIGGIKSAISGVGSVLQSAFATNASLEKTTLQFTTLMGNADMAREHVKGLFDFAKATPFETGPIIEASRMMRVFGGAALDTKANMTLIGDAAAATGAPIQDLGMWVGRMYASMAAGRKDIGEAAQRLTELGVIGPQARAALEQVAAGGGSIETKFKVVQDVLGKFTGAMQAQAGTWDGIMSSLSDVVNLTLADAFKGLYETVRDAMGNVVTVLGSSGVTGALDAVGRAVLNAFGSEQTNQVAGMTRAFVAIGQGASMAAEVAIRAWGAVKAAVLGVLAAINVENSRVMNTLASMPLVGGQFKEAAVYAEAFAASLVKDYEAAKANMTGQSELVQSLQRLRSELGKAANDAIAMATQTKASASGATAAGAATSALGSALGAVGSKVKDARTAYDRWVDSLTRGVTATFQQVNALNAMAQAYSFVADARQRGAGMAVEISGGSRFGMATSLAGLPGTTRMGEVGALGNAISLGGFVPVSNQNTITRRGGIDWGGILKNSPSQLMSVFTGGGNIGAGLGSFAGGVGGQALGSMISMAAKAVGSAGGAMLGSVVPVVGTLVGGVLGKWVGGLFGPSKNAILTKEANARIGTTQGNLLQQFGSVEAIAGTNTAGAELAAAWGSKGVGGEQQFNRLAAEFAAMTEKQNALLTEQGDIESTILGIEKERKALADSLVPTWQTVSGLIEKYGISLDGAGKQIQQLGTTAGFKAVLDDMQTLERAGIDVGGMLAGMADEISGLVNESVRLGTDIPANMKPYIEELVRSGKLLDANGKAFTDLSTFKFGAPVKTEADKVTEAMGKLDEVMKGLTDRLAEIVDALARMLPKAAQQGIDGVQNAFNRANPKMTVDVEYNDPRSGEPASTGYGVGSGGLKNFGAGATVRLHGWEAVLPKGDYESLQAKARSNGGGTTININNPSVRNDGDLDALAARVDQALSRRWSLTQRVAWQGAA